MPSQSDTNQLSKTANLDSEFEGLLRRAVEFFKAPQRPQVKEMGPRKSFRRRLASWLR